MTGDKAGAGTNANCFITIYGKSGITQKISLKKGGKSEFKQNSSTIFKVKSNCVGPMRKVRLEHDNIGIMPGWYVERVSTSKLLLVYLSSVECSMTKFNVFLSFLHQVKVFRLKFKVVF